MNIRKFLPFRAIRGTIFHMNGENIEKLAHTWISAKPGEVDVQSEYYCQTRDVFQTRIDRMLRNLLNKKKYYI